MADSAQEEAVLSAAVAELLVPGPQAPEFGPRHVYLYAAVMGQAAASRGLRLPDSLLARVRRSGLVDGIIEDAPPHDTIDVWTVRLGEVRQISSDTACVDVNTVATDRSPGDGCGFEAEFSSGLYLVRRGDVWLVHHQAYHSVADGILGSPDTARCRQPVPVVPGS